MESGGRSRRVALGTVLLALAAMSPGPGAWAAEPTRQWTPAEVVSQDQVHAFRPAAVVSAVGRTTALWEHDGFVWASHHPDGGAWQEPQRLGRGQLPQGDADARGRVTVVWAGPRHSIDTARWTPRGGWTRPVALSPPPEREGVFGAGMGTLDVGEGGAAAVIFGFVRGDYPDQEKQIRIAYRPARGHWHIAHVTRFGPRIYSGAVAVDADGNADAAFVKRGVVTLRKAAGRGWGSRTRLVGGVRDVVVRLAAGPHGGAVAAWSQRVPHERQQAFGATRNATGWSAPTLLSTGEDRAFVSGLAVDGTGRATVIYLGRRRVEAVDRPPGGAWQPPMSVAHWTEGQNYQAPDLSVNESGDALAAWIRITPAVDGSGERVVEAAYRSGDAWGPTDRLTAEGDGDPGLLDAAVLPSGDGLVVWHHFPEGEPYTQIQARWFRPDQAPT